MNYLISIKTAIIIFPLIAFLFTIPFILHQYHKYGSINKLRVLIIYSFILYMMTIYFLVILPLPSREEAMNLTTAKYQLIPFSFIKDIIDNSPLVLNDIHTYLKALFEPNVYVALFNILMTIPFGMYLRYYFKCSFKRTLGYILILTLFFEITQITGLYFIYPRPYRLFDVDDIILNTLGGVVGYFLMGKVDDFLPTREEIDESAYKEGKVVSGLRRITLFFLDSFLYLFILLFSYMIYQFNYQFIIIFIIYFGLIPSLWHGQTLGSKFLNVRIEFPNKYFIRFILSYIFLYSYYFFSLLFIFAGSMLIRQSMNLSTRESIWLYLGILVFIFAFYFVHVIVILKRGRIYYDKLFKITYVSTIGNEK